MNWYERGILVVPAPEDALVIDALNNVPFKVQGFSEIEFSPRDELTSVDNTTDPIRANFEVKNRGSYNEPDIYYTFIPELIGGNRRHWPSSVFNINYRIVRYRFDGIVDERPLIRDFIERNLDLTKQESYLLSPDRYRFNSFHLCSVDRPEDDDPDIRLTLRRQDDVTKLSLQIARVNIRQGLEYAVWFSELAAQYGQKSAIEVQDGAVV